MGKTTTRILVVLAALFVALAVFQTRRQGGPDPESLGDRALFPHLDLAAVASVRIEQGNAAVTLRRTAPDAWGVAERSGYPVAGEKLRRLALEVAQLKARERLTDNPDKYASVGLGEPPEGGTIALQSDAGEPLALLRLGQRKQTKSAGGLAGQFVRIDADPAVYLVTNAPAVETDTTAWLDRTLLEISADQVVAVEVEHPGGGFAATRREPADPLTLSTPLPAGRTADSGALGDLGRALVNLTCEEVLPEDDPAAADLTFPITFAASTREGVRYRVALAERDGTHYARLGAETLPAPASSPEAATDAAPSAPLPAEPAVATAFTARHQGWTYVVSQYAYDRLAKSLEDLLATE